MLDMVEGCTMESARLSSSLYQLKTENLLTDIAIICHGKIIAAHKCVLAASSQFFKTLFCQDSNYMCGGYFQSCDFTEQLDASVTDFLELIVDFMYSQTIVLTETIVADIAKLAFFFVIDDLLETCYEFINSAVTVKNSLDLYSKLNQVAEFRAGPIYLQSRDKSIDLLKVPFNVIQENFHDLYIQSETLVCAKADDLIGLMSKCVAKGCTIERIIKFVIKWLQKHPSDNGFEVASLFMDLAMEKSRIPVLGVVGSWAHVPYFYERIEKVLYGSNMTQAYQTALLTKMSAILEQLESHDYHVIKQKELMPENAKPETEETTEKSSDNTKEIVNDENAKSETETKDDEIKVRKKGTEKGEPKSYGLRKRKTKCDANKHVSCKICKLEFKEKYQLNKHINRVHSKHGKVSLKIRISKSKLKSKTKKGSKNARSKASDSNLVKEEKLKEKNVTNDSETVDNVNNDTSKIKEEHKYVQADIEREAGDVSDNIPGETGDQDDESKTKDELLDEILKADKSLSDLEEGGHDSDSTIENQPVDLNDQNMIESDNQVDPKFLESVFGDIMQFHCSKCRKIFDSEKDLNKHLNQHPHVRNHKCKQCGLRFKHLANLKKHECKLDKGKTFECLICKEVFDHMRALKTHLQSHSESRPFSCDICKLVYKDEKDFIRHSMLHSQVDKLFECYVCERRFARKYHMTRHMLIHQGKIPRKHKCPHCNDSFSRTKALQKHLPIHNGEPGVNAVYEIPRTSHKCEVCGYVFHDPHNLVRHLRVHTGEKPFVCDICHKAFSQKGQLNIHKLTHGGTRQYQCEMCPKLFLTNSGLHKHRRQVHSNYRPYRCEFCQKQFLQKSDLRRHTPVHTGEKNFQCDICAVCFARKDKLVTHFKQEHMQDLK